MYSDGGVFDSTFWLYWRTICLRLKTWHSALEMKLYFQRFIHHIAGLPDFSALKFTKYNQYESLILPMQKYLEAASVDFQFNTEVTNVVFKFEGDKKIASAIECKVNGKESGIVLTENDSRICYERKLYRGNHLWRSESCPEQEMLKSVQAVYGIFGRILPDRIHPLDIRKNSVLTFQKRTGNLQLLQLSMIRSSHISLIFANVTLGQENCCNRRHRKLSGFKLAA